MPTQRYESAPIRVLQGTEACPPEDRLGLVEATQITGIQRNATFLCKVVAALAVHEGPIPFTQNTLSRNIGYSQAYVSRAVDYLFRTGVVERGGLKKEGMNCRVVGTVVPAEDFCDRVSAVPVWKEAVDTERAEVRLEGIADELGVPRNEALQTLISFYEENRPPAEQ